MLTRSACIFLTILTFLAGAGCSSDNPASARPSGNLNFYDLTGNVVATGNLREVPERAGNGGFTAHWRLLWGKSSFPSSAVANGLVTGKVEDGSISIDLHRPVADNNIVLTGTIKDGVFTGTWHHATFPGAHKMGRFEAFMLSRTGTP
jgi:hypothetical protein